MTTLTRSDQSIKTTTFDAEANLTATSTPSFPAGSSTDSLPTGRPSTPTETPEYINHEVASLLCNPAGLSSSQIGWGYVYILTASHDGTPLVKIGSTKTSPDARKQKHRLQCGATVGNLESFGGPQAVCRFPRHVERLVHTELRDRQYPFGCACGTRSHREYFAVDPGTARRVVQRWIRFCEREPWRFPDHGAPPATDGGGGGGGSISWPYDQDPAGGSPSQSPSRPSRQGASSRGRLEREWANRLERYKDRIAAPAPRKDLEARMQLWDDFVGAEVWDWVWDDVLCGAMALGRYLPTIGTIVALALCVVLCLRIGWGFLARLAMGALVLVLAVTLITVLKDRGWGEPLWRRFARISFTGALVLCADLTFRLDRFFLFWTVMWTLVAYLLSWLLAAVGARCATVEHLLRPMRARGLFRCL